MAASGEERIRQLTQRMLRKKLYVILSKGEATAEQIGAVLPQHLEYISDNESVTHRVAGHHNDATFRQFIAPLPPFHPGKERGLVHLQIGLDVHDGPFVQPL